MKPPRCWVVPGWPWVTHCAFVQGLSLAALFHHGDPHKMAASIKWDSLGYQVKLGDADAVGDGAGDDAKT